MLYVFNPANVEGADRVAHESQSPSLEDRLRVSESQNKELRNALEEMTHTLRKTQELLVYAITNLKTQRAARHHGWVKSPGQSPVAPAGACLDIRKVNSSSTQPTKLTIDYLMNIDGDNSTDENVRAMKEPLSAERTYPANATCSYPSPPFTGQKESESITRTTVRTAETPPLITSRPAFEWSQIQQIIPLITLPEPQRSHSWMRAMFIEDGESEIGQIEFWTLYKDAFSAFATQFPLLSAKELLQRVSEVFPSGQAIEASGSMLMQRYVVRGVRRRS